MSASGLISRRVVLGGLGALTAAGCRRPVPGKGRALVIVFGPQHAPAQPDGLRAELERTSGLKLEIELAKSSDAAVDLVQSGRADAALLPLFDYLFCAGVFEVEPVAQVLRRGAGTQTGDLLVPAQSQVTELVGLRGQRVGYVDRYSVTGFLLAAARLAEASVAVEPVWLGSHDAVLAALKEGKVAAGATYSGHAGPEAGVRVLAGTAPIANEPLFAQARLPSEVRAALKQAFLAAHEPKVLAGLADATAFRDPPAGAYEEALRTLKAAGLRVEDTLEGGWLRANEHRRPAWSYGP